MKETTPKEKALMYLEAIEILTETRPTELDKKHISEYFINAFLNDLKESLEVAREIGNMQAEGLIAGSIVIWNEVLTEIKQQNGK